MTTVLPKEAGEWDAEVEGPTKCHIETISEGGGVGDSAALSIDRGRRRRGLVLGFTQLGNGVRCHLSGLPGRKPGRGAVRFRFYGQIYQDLGDERRRGRWWGCRAVL